MSKRKVHGTGTVARSDGNDADCGAASTDPGALLLSDDPKKVTCQRCLKIAFMAKRADNWGGS